MAKLPYRTHYNYSEYPSKPEVNNDPSETIPDQTMSLSEMVQRYASGLPLRGVKVPIYDGDDTDLPDLANMDLAEKQEIIEQAKEEWKELNRKFDEQRKKKLEKIQLIKLEKILQERQKKQDEKKPEEPK